MEEVINYFSYNSVVILTYFFISLGAFILNTISKGKANKLLFSTYRSSLFKIIYSLSWSWKLESFYE